MIGLGILLVAVVYIGLAIFLAWLFARGFQSRRAKATVRVLTLLVFALIPTWDIIPGRLYFAHLCENEGGVKVRQTVTNVKGFYYFPGAEFRSDALTDFGYLFLEAGSPGSYVYYYISDGKLARQEVRELKSRFGVVFKQSTLPWNIRKYQERVIRLASHEVLATKTQFEYRGSWIQRNARPFLGGGNLCPRLPPSSRAVKEFYLAAMNPGA